MSIFVSRHVRALTAIVLCLSVFTSLQATTLKQAVELALQNSEQLSALKAGVEGVN